MAKPGQMAPLTKSKFGKPLGFGTPDHFKGKVFSPSGAPGGKAMRGGFNPSNFKQTQHKG